MKQKTPPPFRNYREAVNFIYRLHRAKPGVSAVRMDRMSFFLSQMGQPEKKLKVIHITGTSGKGSTSSMLASILKESGYKVGTHTSPHLQSVRERTQIDGVYVTVSQYLEAANRAKRAFDVTVAKGSYGKPDYFQFLTAISLYIFVKQKVDIAVIEVGAGGYGDSTNIVVPLVSVITNVGLDHIGALGNTLEEIASVKSGIIKPNSVVVSGVRQPKPAKVVQSRSRELKCRLITYRDVVCKVRSVWPSYVVADIATKTFNAQRIKVGLTGAYQVKNAGIAVLAAEALKRFCKFSKINTAAIVRGLEAVTIPGRFEVVQHKPKVVLDSAHNPDKMKSFVKLAKKLFVGKSITLVLGFKQGKDYEEMMEILNSTLVPKKVFITEFTSKALKPLDATKALGSARICFRKGARLSVDFSPRKAVRNAIRVTGPEDVVIVTGSMYLVGEVRQIWEKVE